MLRDAAGALVRPLAVARCDLDLPLATGGLFPGPFALGHEALAEVVTVGDRVAMVQPGDRVIVSFQVSCGGVDGDRLCGRNRALIAPGCRRFATPVGRVTS